MKCCQLLLFFILFISCGEQSLKYRLTVQTDQGWAIRNFVKANKLNSILQPGSKIAEAADLIFQSLTSI